MTAFRIFLGAMALAITSYTGITIANYGINLLPIFFGDMTKMAWPGQFNFDFMGMLMLSGLWVAWRHRFSPAGIALGLCAAVGGSLFLSFYLLVISGQVRGDVRGLLMGSDR